MTGREVYVDVPLKHTDPIVVGVNGEKGESCRELTAKLEAALGDVITDTPTHEMYEPKVETTVAVHEPNGY